MADEIVFQPFIQFRRDFPSRSDASALINPVGSFSKSNDYAKYLDYVSEAPFKSFP
jgi:hypothetical protein